MQKKDLETIKGQVEWCLNNISETRDNDITLMITVWEKFYENYVEKFMDPLVSSDIYRIIRLESLHHLPPQDNIKRFRAGFQSKGLYLPNDWKVAKRRFINEGVWRNFHSK